MKNALPIILGAGAILLLASGKKKSSGSSSTNPYENLPGPDDLPETESKTTGPSISFQPRPVSPSGPPPAFVSTSRLPRR